MLKKSIGFNWGPCAASTSYWTGVRLGDLLRKAGVKQGGVYVSFRGPTGELPKGDDGSYGEGAAAAAAIKSISENQWPVMAATVRVHTTCMSCYCCWVHMLGSGRHLR
jgi:DMSO/TMAO reductase YedYZ molybdopterin-dependent catalytic subunit